jgi:hypothetical protein
MPNLPKQPGFFVNPIFFPNSVPSQSMRSRKNTSPLANNRVRQHMSLLQEFPAQLGGEFQQGDRRSTGTGEARGPEKHLDLGDQGQVEEPHVCSHGAEAGGAT